MTVPLVSVVVPTRDSERTLGTCLASIRMQTHPAIELIVVDNDSADATPVIAARACDRFERYGPERSAQRNHGWRISRGQVVLFVDSDMVLGSTVVADVVRVLGADTALGGLVVPEMSFGRGFFARCRVLEKRIYLHNAAAEAARAFPREVLDEVGGFDERLSGFEDWELTDRVVAAGYRIGRGTALIWHDEGRVRLGRAFAKKRYYGQWLPSYLRIRRTAARRRLTRPGVLARPAQLVQAPHLAAGLALLKTAELAGLVVGALRGRLVRPS